MSLTNTAETDLLTLMFNNTNWSNIGDATGLQGSSTAGDFYISLHTATPGETGSDANEVSGGSYARVAVARSAGGWTISGNNASNTAAITFPTATGSWGTITYFGMHYDNGASSMIAYGALTSSKAITTDDVFEFAIGDLDVDLD